jgi:hypothetical protein
VVVLLALLGACGGGGGGSPPPAAPPVDPPTPGVRVSAATPVAAGCDSGGGGTVFVNAEVEPFVAVSPLNAEHLVGVWQQDRVSDAGARALVSAASFDGGRTWARSLHPMSRCGGATRGSAGDHERASDPWVDIGADGSVHLMGLAFSGSSFSANSVNQMLASRSTDGGRTWSAPVSLQRDTASGFNDKNTLTADPTDARYVFGVWDRLDAAGNGPTLMARSTDGGLSWETSRIIHAPAVSGGVSQTIGNRIVVLTDGPERGTLLNVFMQIDTVANRSTATLRIMRSTDKGLSWEAPITIADSRSVGTRDPDTGIAVRDGAVIPQIATGRGGTLWVAWQDARFSGGLRDAIAVSRSSDGGRTWSEPLAVNREPAVAAFIPTLQVRADGVVGLMHYDLRSNTSSRVTLDADLWLLTSRDGVIWAETSITRGFNLAGAPSVTSGLFVGDYQGLVASGNLFIPFVALSGSDSANRTDIHAVRIDPLLPASMQSTREHAARAAQPQPGALSETEFALRRHEAIQRAMERRIPGWRRLVSR